MSSAKRHLLVHLVAELQDTVSEALVRKASHQGSLNWELDDHLKGQMYEKIRTEIIPSNL